MQTEANNPTLDAAVGTGELQLVSFNLGGEEFAVDILHVREINRMMQITRVPKCPHFVEGVVNLRGKIIPVVDLRKRLELPARTADASTRILVTEPGQRTMGLIVDKVNEVLRIPENLIEPPPAVVNGIGSKYITGLGKLGERLLILLDLNKLFSESDIEQLRNLKSETTQENISSDQTTEQP